MALARPYPLRPRLIQTARRLWKQAFWFWFTRFLDRLGLTLQSVQVLVLDRQSGQVLLLKTREYRSGFSPIQGLRRWPYSGDPRLDAARELREEAIQAPALPALERFIPGGCYREGRYRQMYCHVFIVQGRREEFTLRAETGEGKPVWVEVAEAGRLLQSPVLRRLMEAHMTGER